METVFPVWTEMKLHLHMDHNYACGYFCDEIQPRYGIPSGLLSHLEKSLVVCSYIVNKGFSESYNACSYRLPWRLWAPSIGSSAFSFLGNGPVTKTNKQIKNIQIVVQ